MEDLEVALGNVLKSMPPDLMAVSNQEGKRTISAWGAILHLLVGNVEMYMYDTNSYYRDNSKAMAVVRRMLVVMRLLGDSVRTVVGMRRLSEQ